MPCGTAAVALLQGRHLLTFLLHVRCLVKGGSYLGAAIIQVNTVLIKRLYDDLVGAVGLTH